MRSEHASLKRTSLSLTQIKPVEGVQPEAVRLEREKGITRAERKVVGQIETAPADVSAIDRRLGKHMKNALGGRTLAESAANAKHLTRMDQSAGIVALIEKLPGNLNSIAAFKVSHAFRLYEHCFPNDDEREPIKDIKDRIKHYHGLLPADGGDFHAHVYADKDGAVVGYAQGSTVPTKPAGAGLFYYWQYGCVADRDYMREHYGKDVNPREQGVLNTIHGVNAATLLATADRTGKKALGMVWESEPRGLGGTVGAIEFTDLRLSIHNRAGGRVMMGVTREGELVNLHLQPRLTADSDPIALHMVYRDLSYEVGDELRRGKLEKTHAKAIMMGWIDNFRREGFAKKDVDEAKREIKTRFARCKEIVLLPANEVPDLITLAKSDEILRAQVLDEYGVKTLEEARQFHQGAMELASSLRACGAEVSKTKDQALQQRFDELAKRVRASSDPSEWPRFAQEIEQLQLSIMRN